MKKIVSIFLLAGLLIIEYRTGIRLHKTLLEENVKESETSQMQDEPEITRQSFALSRTYYHADMGRLAYLCTGDHRADAEKGYGFY